MKSAISFSSVRSEYLLAAMLFAGILISPAFAGPKFRGSESKIPDFHCAESNDRCERSCDDLANDTKNANAYQRCLDQYEKDYRNCEERQEKVNRCAPVYLNCSQDAGGDKEKKQKCIDDYHSCRSED